MIRVNVTRNYGPESGRPAATALVKPPSTRALLAAAANKLRLSKKQTLKARLFVWPGGHELHPDDDDLRRVVSDGALVAVSLGEEYTGPRRVPAAATAAAPVAAAALDSSEAQWDVRTAKLAVVEWASMKPMNEALGRMSTLLEHPTLCSIETKSLVGLERQRGLPSSRYQGHNLYDSTIAAFERLSERQGGDGASEAEVAFIRDWRARGEAAVVISYVRGEESTLRHELAHARFALDEGYRQAVLEAWADAERTERAPGALRKWMLSLGYHPSRHPDEFGAYLLTEPSDSFWRGRIEREQLHALRAALAAACEAGAACFDARVLETRARVDG